LADAIADAVIVGGSAKNSLPKNINSNSVTRLGFRVEGFSRLCERVSRRHEELVQIYNQ
jgi:hypothetical protein